MYGSELKKQIEIGTARVILVSYIRDIMRRTNLSVAEAIELARESINVALENSHIASIVNTKENDEATYPDNG